MLGICWLRGIMNLLLLILLEVIVTSYEAVLSSIVVLPCVVHAYYGDSDEELCV